MGKKTVRRMRIGSVGFIPETPSRNRDQAINAIKMVESPNSISSILEVTPPMGLSGFDNFGTGKKNFLNPLLS